MLFQLLELIFPFQLHEIIIKQYELPGKRLQREGSKGFRLGIIIAQVVKLVLKKIVG